MFRDFLERPTFAKLRTHIALGEARRAAKAVQTQPNSYPNQAINLTKLVRGIDVSSTDFFILGSGGSINDLSEQNFFEIGSNVSVGINAWVLHDFVPNLYSYEPVPNANTDHFSTLSYLNRPEIISASPRVLILKPRNPFEWEQLNQLPDSLRSRVMVYGRFSPYTRKIENLPRDLTLLLMRHCRDRRQTVLMDSGASIVRMAYLGVLLGFRRIVFVGVDLNTTTYFWEDNPRFLEKYSLRSFGSGQQGTVHETVSAVNRPFSVTEMLPALAFAANKTVGSQFFVGSPNSLLAERLPVFSWRK